MKSRRSRRPHQVLVSARTARPGGVAWAFVAAVFLAGLVVRVEALNAFRVVGPNQTVPVSRWEPFTQRPLLENDEKTYLALVEQLEAGRGYTLQGHPILDEPWIVREQYDRPLFFHPPGGIALFWLFHRAIGDAGPALAQVCCFATFFWSVMWLGATLLAPLDSVTMALLAVSAAFSPIMAQVAGRLWLDGPLLASSTAAWAMFVRGHAIRKPGLVCAAGAVLGYASWIKLTACLVVPGAIAAAWCLTARDDRRRLVTASLFFVGIAALVQLPWEVWQWRVLGTPWPGWAGKPAGALVQTNAYVRYLTVNRPPWIYLELLPQVIWTTVPSLVLLGLQWRNRRVWVRGTALVVGMAVVVGANIALGAMGYSKVLRYAILVTPATSVLFALVAGATLGGWHNARGFPGGRPVVAALIILALAGLGLEVTQSLKTTFADCGSDLIQPLTGLRDLGP